MSEGAALFRSTLGYGLTGEDALENLNRLISRLCRLAGLAACCAPLLSVAQLPKPAAVVYRCEVGGKVVYSDEPCVSAKVIDATPNSGVDSLSGHKRIGADVRREQFNRQLGEALRPIGSSPEKFTADVRRADLSTEAKLACSALDRQIPTLEQNRAPANEIYQARKRYRDLKC